MSSPGEKALHAALKKRAFDPVYYFYGDDDFLKDGRLREVIDAAIEASMRDFNLELRRGSELDTQGLDVLLSTPPMLSERRVAVIRDVDKLKKDPRKLLDGYLAKPAADTLLLLVSPSGVKPDRGLAERSTAVEFAPLTGDRVPKWVTYFAESELKREISPDAVTLLVEAIGDDLQSLSVELEKLASFTDGMIDERAVEAVVGIRRGDAPGDFLDAVASRDAASALRMLPGVLEQPKISAVGLVMSLTTQTLALGYAAAAVARGAHPRTLYGELMSLLKETGAFPGRPWGEAVGAWTKFADHWSVSEANDALSALLLADLALKETRISSDEQLLTSLVLTLCGASTRHRAA
jgi:DNA polymerase III subunit delta